MEIRFKRVEEAMPKEHEVVLVFLQSDDQGEDLWTLAFNEGGEWCFDVSAEVMRQAETVTGCELPEQETMVGIDSSRISHWAELPHHPGFEAVPLSEVETTTAPQVRYNRTDDAIEIFDGTTSYTEEDPYFLTRRHFNSPSAALKSMARIAPKRWAAPESFLYALAAALNEGLEAKQ